MALCNEYKLVKSPLKGAGDGTVKDPIITSDTCDEYNVLCNYPLGPNEAGYEYLKMVKQEWNSTQLIQVTDLDKLSVIKGDYDIKFFDVSGNLIEETKVQVKDGCELMPTDFEDNLLENQLYSIVQGRVC